MLLISSRRLSACTSLRVALMKKCVISGFRRGVDDTVSLLGCYLFALGWRSPKNAAWIVKDRIEAGNAEVQE